MIPTDTGDSSTTDLCVRIINVLAPCQRLVLILLNWAIFCQELRWCKIMKNGENLFKEGTNKKSFSPDSYK